MLIQIDKHSGVPVYRQVMEQVTRQIMTGQLQEMQQVDSVAGLSGLLKVNPMTVSKAYGYLVQEGLLERRAGIGLFVRKINTDTKKEHKDSLLTEVMDKAASLAIQVNLDVDEAQALFIEHYKKIIKNRN